MANEVSRSFYARTHAFTDVRSELQSTVGLTKMASIVSPEMNTMIDLSHELTAALSSTPMRVTRALVRKKFVQSDVLLEMLIDDTPTGKTVILVDAVKKTIEASPAKFSELIEILSELSWATNVVENLRSIYQREFRGR